tara:strand:+ start:55 stop:1146 length:1092 start_codon:yes stop_codon:yes gene_type:complete
MSYDRHGRWVPDGEAINWAANRVDLRKDLIERGLDWRDEGAYAYRTKAWEQMTEDQRLDVLERYDTWYDAGDVLALDSTSWGLDLERGITYSSFEGWNAQQAFHDLSGGDSTSKWIQTSGGSFWRSVSGIDYKHDPNYEAIAQEGDKTLFTAREFPMDWKSYSEDDLYRATIDELIEKDYTLFLGPGDNFTNARQVRAATSEIQSWVNDVYRKAHEEGKTIEEADAEWERYIANQKLDASIHNRPDHNKFHHETRAQLQKFQPWNRFDPETGTTTKLNPLTGEVRDTFKHKSPAEPTRMTITGNATSENIDAGIFYSPTLNQEQELTDTLLDKPADVTKYKPTIREYTPTKPGNLTFDNKVAE